MDRYYSVVIPYVDRAHATEWHPTDRDFAPLSRGNFATEGDAIAWARRLGGTPYSIRVYENRDNVNADVTEERLSNGDPMGAWRNMGTNGTPAKCQYVRHVGSFALWVEYDAREGHISIPWRWSIWLFGVRLETGACDCESAARGMADIRLDVVRDRVQAALVTSCINR